ncbi:histidine phosphatase family protein [Roseobacter sp. YSTF-M11]|uniref:Histidine phosphatase family protein n=1 Tax=Roseobacter insulae TaxID=2859783 RepID=A0A9X1JXM1_9RHOB|nr:histidine phosphatase family protein [Roseobacter insulae]MBW4707131.1 histidine phosphatase family protein [Roseobacter insulae]
MIRLGLLRHGHTSWNRQGRIQGRTDMPLDPDAEAQLTTYALPSPWDKAQLWASPLMRAKHTAQLIAGREPVVDDALIEMDWGDWEGLRGIDLRSDPASGFKDIEDWGWSYMPPNGESPDVLRRRLVPWAQNLTGDAVAVCHIGVMRVLLAHATGWNFEGPAAFRVKRHRLFVIEIDGPKWTALDTPVRLKVRAT